MKHIEACCAEALYASPRRSHRGVLMLRNFFFCLATLLLVAGQLSSQSATATISGIVTDSSGGAVPRAQVKATNISTNVARTAASAEDGSFSLTFLPLGTYR